MTMTHKKIHQLDLNLLKIFEVVYRERHLSHAAQSLALTPSAVSHAIGRLRDYLDDELFIRTGRTMQPTVACQRMAPGLLEQLARLHQMLQQWGHFDPLETRQTFRISMPDAIEAMLLPPLALALAQRAPQAVLASSPVYRQGMSSALATGNLDLVVDVALPVSAPLRHQVLLEDAFCVVARAGHPLASGMSLAAYLEADHAAVSTRAKGVVLEDVALLKLGLQRKVAVRCQNYYSACRLLLQSDYLLTMPARLSRQIDASRALIQLTLPFSLPPIQLHMYWHANSEDDHANQWLRQLLADIELHKQFI